MSEEEGALYHNGEVYISVPCLMAVLNGLIGLRDHAVKENPEMAVLVPGSDHTIQFLSELYMMVREDYLEKEDLTEETDKMVNEIYGFLDEQ